MKLPFHKKVDRIKTGTPWEIHPYLSIKISNFNWMKETIINQEKEIFELNRRLTLANLSLRRSGRREY